MAMICETCQCRECISKSCNLCFYCNKGDMYKSKEEKKCIRYQEEREDKEDCNK